MQINQTKFKEKVMNQVVGINSICKYTKAAKPFECSEATFLEQSKTATNMQQLSYVRASPRPYGKYKINLNFFVGCGGWWVGAWRWWC